MNDTKEKMSKWYKKLTNPKDLDKDHFNYIKLLLQPNYIPQDKNRVDEKYYYERLKYIRKKINRLANKRFLTNDGKTTTYLRPLIDYGLVEVTKERVYYGESKSFKNKDIEFLSLKKTAFKKLFMIFYERKELTFFKNSRYYNKYHEYFFNIVKEGLFSSLLPQDHFDIIYLYFKDKKKLQNIIYEIQNQFYNNKYLKTIQLNLDVRNIIDLLSISISLNRKIVNSFSSNIEVKLETAFIFNLFNLLRDIQIEGKLKLIKTEESKKK